MAAAESRQTDVLSLDIPSILIRKTGKEGRDSTTVQVGPPNSSPTSGAGPGTLAAPCAPIHAQAVANAPPATAAPDAPATQGRGRRRAGRVARQQPARRLPTL